MNRLALLLLCVTSCATQRARSLDLETDYTRLGLTKAIAPWEDGRRTDGAPGTFEWWYFDAHLDDGSTLVVVFYDKPLSRVGDPVTPGVGIELTRADGTKVSGSSWTTGDHFSSSKERCDVRIADARFEGDLHRYHIVASNPSIAIDMELEGTVAAWRPATGSIAFGDHDERHFSWLPAVPQGEVKGTVTLGGHSQTVHGVGYHDHNWGNAAIPDLLHDWYWGRAQVGDYTVIASFITAEERYGRAQFPIFFLAKGGQVLADDGRKVRFSQSTLAWDDETRKAWAPRLTWEFNDEAHHYRVTFTQRRTLTRASLLAGLSGFPLLVTRLAELNPAYLRFTGEVTVEELEGDVVTKTTRNTAAVWELMALGRP